MKSSALRSSDRMSTQRSLSASLDDSFALVACVDNVVNFGARAEMPMDVGSCLLLRRRRVLRLCAESTEAVAAAVVAGVGSTVASRRSDGRQHRRVVILLRMREDENESLCRAWVERDERRRVEICHMRYRIKLYHYYQTY